MTVTPFTPLESLAGGALIGASAVLLLFTTGRLAGISGIVRRLLPPYAASAPLEAAAFIAALFASPFVWTLATGGPVHQTVTPSLSLAVVAGLLVGAGVFAARGCTSGHGVCGLARLSRRSIVATAVFMATAAATVYAVRHVIGGWPWA
ncbi:MAG: YeeE/YedE family protein [Hyphomicrobium zavarzinii]|uniref:YeeE/YedE family protein n=1 Tax=Hyphomicrobium zavarzinii TaxID=48292 RepID=UPI001A528499|nr:YeeE/YedE thiosulfate transporter family protein [Hyphomicrobium zavarzinii]MBL8846039.1 YeeE/YedE family protein [Hyphomicrobium zavarzinii]